MSLDLIQLFFIGIGYLLFLFGVAYISERDWFPQVIVSHPMTYILSLGVFGTAWSFYGVVDMAYRYGHGVLTYYMGTASLFLFAPLFLLPILRITRMYQLASLPDLLAFRYRSKAVGGIASVLMLLGVIPLIALQIQAVSDTLHILSQETLFLIEDADFNYYSETTAQDSVAFTFCIAIAFFTILFGSRQEQHKGLVVAMAFESLVKTIALIIVGIYSVYVIFGSYAGLDSWLQENTDMLSLLREPREDFNIRTLLLIFFSAAIAMPHLFHIMFSETPHPRAISSASWGMPLFLLIMSLPIFPILWGGTALRTDLSREYYTLAIGIETNSTWLSIVTFIGGLSAASGAIIVITLSLANICMNHLILPLYQPSAERNLYRWILWVKRITIIFIILSSYLFWEVVGNRHSLSELAIVAFIGALQFLPGVIAVLYMPKANRNGYIAGTLVGTTVWISALLIPMLTGAKILEIPFYNDPIPIEGAWDMTAIISLGANIAFFFIFSLFTSTRSEEKSAARACAVNNLNRQTRRELDVNSAKEFKEALSVSLGDVTAEQEVTRALQELQMKESESRPYALRRLRDKVEANLSGLMGPAIANEIINELLPFTEKNLDAGQEDIHFIENRLTEYRSYLTGLAAELNNLRLYHRQTLQDLPLAACSLGNDNEILMWNESMARLTNIASEEATGSNVRSLGEPWKSLLSNFIATDTQHSHKQHFELDSKPHWVNLHKSLIGKADNKDGSVVLLEDLTENQLLENELAHSERLASIGRLAAGVAHEIGNPITGIACLSQNLRYETDNPELHEIAEQILGQTKRVTKIVQSLVNFSHVGSNSTDHEQSAVDLFHCAQEAIDLLSLKQNNHAITYENKIDQSLRAHGDFQRLLQVFVNLISNAKDASPEGGKITVEGLLEEDTSDSIHITISDEGEGIPADVLQEIFEPFYTTKDPGKGTGLGLSLVYSIIEDHFGHISVISPRLDTNNGTTFTIILPRYPDTDINDTIGNNILMN